MARGDERLGLNAPITRRDFVNGTLVAAAGLLAGCGARVTGSAASPAEDFDGYGGVGEYASSNGNTWKVMSAGHAMRDGQFERAIAGAADTGEIYDLVVVGGGLSGLAAAVFFQKDQEGRCLVLDNHPMFGGEAKRNEFVVDGQRVVAHQGSAIFLVPGRGGYTERFYDLIGMDRRAFDYQRWRGPDPEIPLAHDPYDTPGRSGFWFGPEFTKGAGVWVMDPWERRLDGAPIGDAAKIELLRAHESPDDGAYPRPRREGDAASRTLDSVTYEEFLMARHRISRDTVRRFLFTEGGGYGIGPDVLSAYCSCAIETEFPEDGDDTLGVQMFPDGNTGFARLMVKTLIPEAFDGPRGVDAVWRNPVRFGALDRSASTRIRLNATVVRVGHAGESSRAPHVNVTYAIDGRLYRVTARRVVMSGGSWTTKHVVHDLPQAHRDAYAEFYRSPCLMANVAVRNWRFLYRMGLSACRWFGGLGDSLTVRRQALLDGIDPTFGPDSPTVLTIKVLFGRAGLPLAQQGTLGRAELLGTTFAQYERRLREQLGDMFGGSGFDPRRDIAGIILNRWGHAYVNPQPGFFFGLNGQPAPRDVLRNAPFGRIGFANTDLAGAADHRNSIREADRAVRQLASA